MSLLDIAIHDVLSLWADHQTGICWASAEKINALAPSEFSYKSVQRSLAKLERIGWIKRWVTKGKRGNYPVLICRYFVRDASMTWMSTSAERTTDWRDVKFDAVHDPSFNGPPGVRSDVRERGGELSVVVSGVQEGRPEKPEEKDSEFEFECEDDGEKQKKALDECFEGFDLPPGKILTITSDLFQSLAIDQSRLSEREIKALQALGDTWEKSWKKIKAREIDLLWWISTAMDQMTRSKIWYPKILERRAHEMNDRRIVGWE